MTHTKSTSIGALLNSGAKIAGSKDKKSFIKVAMCSRKQRCVWVAGFFRLQNDGGVKQSGWRWESEAGTGAGTWLDSISWWAYRWPYVGGLQTVGLIIFHFLIAADAGANSA
jgi:hypothetical protein